LPRLIQASAGLIIPQIGELANVGTASGAPSRPGRNHRLQIGGN
jgi:hypothetical protein